MRTSTPACSLVRRRHAIWLQFIFSEPIRFLPEGIDVRVQASGASGESLSCSYTAQATRTKTLDLEDINVGIGTPLVGSKQVARFQAQVLDTQGTTLTNIYFIHDPKYYNVKPGDTTWKCFRTGKPRILPKGLAEALQDLYPGGHRAHIVASPSRRKRTTTTSSTQDGSSSSKTGLR